MHVEKNQKIQAHHLKRNALIYVRQSGPRQVLLNIESTARQYGLKGKAAELGWDADLIEVIDEDLGKSARTSTHRNGFQRLVAEVALGHVGIVMGLEISRLARNNADFQQLLQICGINKTLIYDADAIYDLMTLNDRLILGLKGTMSEAELFTIRSRLVGGALNKAARGDLGTKLPIGFVYSPTAKVILDPDCQVQEAMKLFFETFRKVGSSKGVVGHFYRQQIKFPTRPVKGPHKGELFWTPLSSGLALRILHSPRYAGAFSYGRTRATKTVNNGNSSTKRTREEWHALVKDHHPGYISWEEFEENERRLTENRSNSCRSPVREGPGLLQGIAICGTCGHNFSTAYKMLAGGIAPTYICNRDRLDYGKSICTHIPGKGIDEIVTAILLEKVTPMAVEAAMSVQQEILRRAEEADKLLRRQVERAQYEADLAKRRLLAIDPENRLVGRTLEKEWNEKLEQLEQARKDYEERRLNNQCILSDEKKTEIRQIASDFPNIWKHEATSHRDKKRMTRLLIEDVTLKRQNNQVEVFVRFKAGAIERKSCTIPHSGYVRHVIQPELIQTIEKLAETHTAGETAKQLNAVGAKHPTLGRFDTNAVVYLCKCFGITTRYQRLRAKGYQSQEEVAEKFRVETQTVRRWRKLGWISGEHYNDQEYLYAPVHGNLPAQCRSAHAVLQ